VRAESDAANISKVEQGINWQTQHSEERTMCSSASNPRPSLATTEGEMVFAAENVMSNNPIQPRFRTQTSQNYSQLLSSFASTGRDIQINNFVAPQLMLSRHFRVQPHFDQLPARNTNAFVDLEANVNAVVASLVSKLLQLPPRTQQNILVQLNAWQVQSSNVLSEVNQLYHFVLRLPVSERTADLHMYASRIFFLAPTISLREKKLKPSLENLKARLDQLPEMVHLSQKTANLVGQLDQLDQKIAKIKRKIDVWKKLTDVSHALRNKLLTSSFSSDRKLVLMLEQAIDQAELELHHEEQCATANARNKSEEQLSDLEDMQVIQMASLVFEQYAKMCNEMEEQKIHALLENPQ
jgi:hypothetical protein